MAQRALALVTAALLLAGSDVPPVAAAQPVALAPPVAPAGSVAPVDAAGAIAPVDRVTPGGPVAPPAPLPFAVRIVPPAPPAAATPIPAAAPAQPLICRSTLATGSLIMRHRQCLTKAQWRYVDDAHETEARRLMMDNMNKPGCNGSAC